MRSSIYMIMMILVGIPAVHAGLALDDIQFDPAIISGGDQVDIVVQFHDESVAPSERLANPDWTFKVKIEPDDTLTEQYILFQDAEGDDLHGSIFGGNTYVKRFRVKVIQNAPAADYEFKLTGTWYHLGLPEESGQYVRFTMPVKKEATSLSIANVVSDPQKIRAGDKEILLSTDLFNSGEKPAKNVTITLRYPEGISSSYTNDNRLVVGTIGSIESKSLSFYIDTDNGLAEGTYFINYRISYQDLDGNSYLSENSFPINLKKKPYIRVISSEGSGRAGSDVELVVMVKNTGQEAADSVDIRLLKQSSQPFSMDVRSEYLGRMEPNSTAVAIFSISALDSAAMKDHTLNVLIRAKGDSHEGDDTIYTYADSVSVSITGKPRNYFPLIAVLFLVAAVAIWKFYPRSHGKTKRS